MPSRRVGCGPRSGRGPWSRWLGALVVAGIAVVVVPAHAGAQAFDPDAAVSDRSALAVDAPHGPRGVKGELGSRRRVPRGELEAIGPFVGPVLGGDLVPAPAATDSLIGFDTRSQSFDNTGAPGRMVALITNNGNQFCTGFLIGRDTLATAGHCVHTGGSTGAWYPVAALRVYPGYSSAASNRAPFGSCGVRSLHAPAGWIVNGTDEHDYGAMKLDCTVGNRTGWFGWWWQPKSLEGQITKVVGYPGDKPQELWKTKDYVRVSEARRLFYANDTTGGNSGSPVFRIRGASEVGCQGPCVMAIHAYGVYGEWPFAAYNHGPRITQEVSDNFFLWQRL
jgi:glutamyl endopeptidase